MTSFSVALVVAGVGVGLAALVALHVLATGLSPLRSPVSQYGIGRFSCLYRLQTVAYGVAGLGAALGIATLRDASPAVIGLCALFAVARGAISWFPMDAPGAERSRTGLRHRLLAGCAFGAVAVAANQLQKMLDHDASQPGVAGASAALGAAMLVAFVAMGVDRRVAGGHFGLIERAFYATMTAWLVLVAVLVAVGS